MAVLFPKEQEASDLTSASKPRGRGFRFRQDTVDVRGADRNAGSRNQMPISENLDRFRKLWPAAMILLAVILTVGWVATLVWFFGSFVWAAF